MHSSPSAKPTLPKLDNTTLDEKVRLRRHVLARMAEPPFVLETNGGYGRIYERTWFKARGGAVLELDDRKIMHLAHQRPHWMVYQGDCIKALAAGFLKSTPFDIIDLDPYGQSFELLKAIAVPGRIFPDAWHLVVNDGSWEKICRGGAWSMHSMSEAIRRHGIFITQPVYEKIIGEMVTELADAIGFDIAEFRLNWCGKKGRIIHYWAVMTRKKSVPSVVQ